MKVIESITIRYFRSIYTLNIKNCEDLTVITGKNDVGKSNILKALNLFFCQQSDYLHEMNFTEDYSVLRKEEVKKDTVRGQQFISITVRFLRGDRKINSLPPSFSVTKRWDMHSKEPKITTDVYARMELYAKKNGKKYSERITTTSLSAFLNQIKFIYIPAIKDNSVFMEVLNTLQNNIFSSNKKKSLDKPIKEANQTLNNLVSELQEDFRKATGIINFIELPNTLNYINGLLKINTNAANSVISIDKRGDGIRSHYIPKILNYVAKNSKKIYIWGFEEPENSYEYRRCLQVANEFNNEYAKNSQIFITSHSPAFFSNESENKIIIRVGNEDCKTIILKDDNPLDEELGYIELYKDFIEQLKILQKDNSNKKAELNTLKKVLKDAKNPIVLTEGKTDAQLLKLAIKKLNLKEFSDWEIKPVISGKTNNNEALVRFLQDMSDNMSAIKPVIGMFDRDTEIKMKCKNGEIKDIRTCDFVDLDNNVYAFAIPVPHNRAEENQISIEHYFTDQEIKTEIDGKRLFMGNEFYETGVCKENKQLFFSAARNVSETIKIIEHESKKYVKEIDGTGDYSISKERFVEAIESGCDGFKDISFEEFYKIFNILKEISQIAR